MESFREAAERELKIVEARRKALLQLLATYDNGLKADKVQLDLLSENPANSMTVREKIIDVVEKLVTMRDGRGVTVKDILAYVEENDIQLGNSTRYLSTVTATLSQEVRKKVPKVVRIKRGVFNIKKAEE